MIVLFSIVLATLLSHSAQSLSVSSVIQPEVRTERLNQVSNLINLALGDGKGEKDGRYESARKAALELGDEKQAYELVYGELSIPVLATILDAVGVEKGDRFLDIGSGDGALVLGASLLFVDEEDGQNAIKVARGLEIVPGLFDRSRRHEEALRSILEPSPLLQENQSPIEFALGDVHAAKSDQSVASILQDTTLVVCFATTWSAGNAKGNSLKGRRLEELSKALSMLPKGARIVIVDGRIDRKDGHEWQGDLTVECPDTAPFSIASLYLKV